MSEREDLVLYDVQDGVAVLTLNAPPANTYSHEMMRRLDQCILEARFDSAVHVLVLRGMGEKFFCAGADIGMLREADPAYKYYFCLHANETLNRLEQTPKLVIAALNGHTVGGGLEVALAADLRVACAGKAKIGLPEVALGVLPGTGGTQRLARLVGKGRALELMAEGRNLSVEEARETGLVHRVLPAERFAEEARTFAEDLAGRAPLALSAAKEAIRRGVEVELETGLRIEQSCFERTMRSKDAAGAMRAWLAGRRWTWMGE